MKDESKRRDYDLIYPSITRTRPSPQNTQTPRPPPNSTPRSEALSDEAQIAAIRKSKHERSERWWSKKNAFDTSIFELQRRIRRLEQEITNLDRFLASEAAAEAWKNSWGAWLLSPISKKAEDSEEERERKDRVRQEKRIEKDLKERRLELTKAELKTEENLLKKAKGEVDAADRGDEEKIRVIQTRIWARENRERQERERKEKERKEREWKEIQRQERERQEKERRERQERERQETERMAKFWKQQQEQWEKDKREAAEALRKQQEKRAAEQKRKETGNFPKQHRHLNRSEGSTAQAYTPNCRHDGWWPKVQGRAECPECYESWTYLLKCPGCMMKACPRCQAAIRPRIPRNTARTNRRGPPRARTPSPDFSYHYDW